MHGRFSEATYQRHTYPARYPDKAWEVLAEGHAYVDPVFLEVEGGGATIRTRKQGRIQGEYRPLPPRTCPIRTNARYPAVSVSGYCRSIGLARAVEFCGPMRIFRAWHKFLWTFYGLLRANRVFPFSPRITRPHTNRVRAFWLVFYVFNSETTVS